MDTTMDRFNEIRKRFKEGKCTEVDIKELEKLLENIDDSVKKIRAALIEGW
jgi:hypothetical protein